MTKTRALQTPGTAIRLALLAALFASALLFAPGARPGGSGIAACDGVTNACGVASVPAASGVYFTVSAGGGNRDFASIEVDCADNYSTVINVIVPAKGSGTSQVVYPPAGACSATQEKQMQIGKAHQLATVSFTVTP